MLTSAIEAAASIISRVIFGAACAWACAHSTPGNNVDPKPIPVQAAINRRRSSMSGPPLGTGAYYTIHAQVALQGRYFLPAVGKNGSRNKKGPASKGRPSE